MIESGKLPPDEFRTLGRGPNYAGQAFLTRPLTIFERSQRDVVERLVPSARPQRSQLDVVAESVSLG